MSPSPTFRLTCLASARSVGQRWRSYLALAAVAAAALAAVTVGSQIGLRMSSAGMVLAAVAVLVVAGLVGLATPPKDGRFATQWTLAGLDQVPGWTVLESAAPERRDADHIVIAPAAILAVSTYDDARHDATADRVAGDARYRRNLDAAERSAHAIRRFLQLQNRHENAVVVPVLAVRGPDAAARPDGHCTREGVRVIDGDRPDVWIRLFSTPRIDAGARRELAARLKKYSARPAGRNVGAIPAPSHALGRELGRELWHEFVAGVAHARSTHVAHHLRTRGRSRRFGVRLVPAPGAVAGPGGSGNHGGQSVTL